MRCDDDRPVHHLLRATATTSRDHLTRPPHATTTTFAIVHAHRSDVTSIHPSSAPPSSSSSRSVDRPTGTTPIEPFDRPFDRADRPTVRSSRSTDRSIEPFVRPFDRAVRPTASIPSHPIIPSHRAALSLEISRADDGHRVEDTWRTTHLHYGDAPPTHTTRVYIDRPRGSRSRVPLRFTTHHESSTETRVCLIPPITTRRDHPRPTRPTACPRWWVTRRRPRVVTRARAFRTGHRRRARATFGRSTHARGHCLRRRPTRDRSRGEDVEDVEYDARQPRRAGDDRARARGDDGTRERRDVRGEGRGGERMRMDAIARWRERGR